MQRTKEARRVARSLFTRSANKIESYLRDDVEKHVVAAEFENLSQKNRTLEELQNNVLSLWLDDSEKDEALFEADLNSSEEFTDRWYLIKQKVKEFMDHHKMSTIKEANPNDGSSLSSSKSYSYKVRLPKLELPKFDGSTSKWLAFWTQYKKIHADEHLSNDDKFSYLLQCMEHGSNARELVESFPPSGENYEAAVTQLKERFARDELIIEHYVRELLQLVSMQTKGTMKTPTRSLYDKLMTQILALHSLGVTQDKYAAFLYPLVESALPEDILRAWNRSHMHVASKQGTPLTELLNFVKKEVEAEERIHLSRTGGSNGCLSSTPTAACLATTDKSYDKDAQPGQIRGKECLWCDKTSHSSCECRVAVNKSLEERREFVRGKKACSICLNKGHSWKRCRKYPKCIICSKRHYTIMCDSLHKEKETCSKSADQPSTSNQMNVSSTTKTVLLPTLKVKLSYGEKNIQVRALLDSGAQRSFIRKDVVKKLELKPVGAQELSHVLFGGAVTKKLKQNLYQLDMESLDGQYKRQIEALEQETICGYLPTIRKGSVVSYMEKFNVQFTDCVDNVTEISLLIGSDISGSLFTGRSIQIDENLLAVETKLGWTVQGPALGVYCSMGNVDKLALNNALSFTVEDFWKLETLGISDQSEVVSQQKLNSETVSFFKDTIRVNEEGRYEVNLPWKPSADLLQTNYKLALNRLKSTTNKLSKLGILSDYNKVFEEWLQTDIIEEVQNDNPNRGHYMPHHAVVKESSLTTKIRPVFDASAKDFNGLSLNACLESGINLIELIPKLLIQFRRNAIGITADIKKAFLQISLNPNDREYLKFLWWRDISEVKRIPIVFRHRRVVFGVTTSLFLLSGTILHHLEQFEGIIPDKLKTSFYIDNLVISVKNKNEMKYFITEAKNIMMKGKFELRCWVTGPAITDGEVSTTSVLGLMWDPKKDEIFCKVHHIENKLKNTVNKRFVLSVAQSVFDPLGIICAATIVPKLVIQKCWILNIDWDQDLPKDLEKTINDWLGQLKFLELCHLPRSLSQNDLDQSSNSIHVFCDASKAAYAACIFLRSENDNSVDVRLVLAKARVAPTKSITIPRLELIAALLAVRLASDVKKGLELECDVVFWTDSSIVISWLKRGVGLSVFVQNRVNEILAKSSIAAWRHVPGDLNPADLPSRGCSPETLFKSNWWKGPGWLRASPTAWPQSDKSLSSTEEQEIIKEVKKSCMMFQDRVMFSESLCYFSKYTKLIRMVGWIFRFAFNCSQPNQQRKKGNLCMEEFIHAEIRVLKVIQTDYFDTKENLNSRINLETFKDNSGLIRVKTRLTLTNDTYDFKCPVLLPNKCKIVERLITQKHVLYLHAGSQTLISKLREEFWIIGIRRLARKIIQKCVVCRRYSAKACSVPCPPLPVDRVNCGSVFEVTGVDFAGPLLLKSGSKCWIVLFTCATYRAIHLEICTSLSTEDFLLALRRFLARRGCVRVIYSDNGTNLRGASNLLKSINWEDVSNQMSVQKISWRHIVPSAPWWGGFWERLVKVVKDVLRRILGKASLQMNELATVICEVEALINSRPLTYIASSTENVAPLTPSMFLNVSINNSSNDELFVHISGKILSSRWNYLRELQNNLKQRFRSEYLSLLAQKTSASKFRDKLKVGDVVLVGTDDKRRLDWSLGIILEIISGRDNRNRVARVRTQTGELLRPFQRLYPMEHCTSDNDPL